MSWAFHPFYMWFREEFQARQNQTGLYLQTLCFLVRLRRKKKKKAAWKVDCCPALQIMWASVDCSGYCPTFEWTPLVEAQWSNPASVNVKTMWKQWDNTVSFAVKFNPIQRVTQEADFYWKEGDLEQNSRGTKKFKGCQLVLTCVLISKKGVQYSY